MSVVKKLASQTAVYGVSSIVGRVLSYLLTPLYTGAFAAAEFGVVTGIFAYVSFLNVVFTYGMETTYFRFANRPGTDRRALYDRVLSLLLVSTVVLTAGLMLLSKPLLALLGIPPGNEPYGVWMALILGLDALTAIPFARLRLENQARKFAAIKLANIVATVVLNLFFLLLCPAVASGKWLPGLQPLVARVYDPSIGVSYVFLSTLFASGLTLLLLWREVLDFRFRLNLAFLRPLLAYAYPLMFMGLAGMVNETMDRIMLPIWLPKDFYPGLSSLAAVGIYGACYKLSIFMQLVNQAFRYAAEPFFFSQAADKNSPATFAMIMKWYTLCCAVIFVGVSLNVEDFGQLFLKRPEYLQGLVVVPILLLANLFLGMYYNLSVWFKLTDKTYFGTYIGAGGAVLTIALNFLLIPVLGYLGCAIATLAVYFMMAVLCWRLGERHFPVPYPALRLGLWLLGAAGLVGLGWGVQVEDWWLRHAWHAGLTLAFLLALYLGERPRRVAVA